jgi:hypothetical protein
LFDSDDENDGDFELDEDDTIEDIDVIMKKLDKKGPMGNLDFQRCFFRMFKAFYSTMKQKNEDLHEEFI